MPRKLTTNKAQVPERWELFAEEYLVDLNATRAAERAGYAPKGAEQRGYELMRDARVQQRLKELMQKRTERVEINQQQVLQELKDQLSVTIPDLVFWTDEVVHIKEHSDLTHAERKAVKKLKIKKTVKERYNKDGDLVSSNTTFDYEVELHDRLHLIEMVGKHIGMWKDTHVHIHNPTDFQGVPDDRLEQRLKEIRALRVTNNDKPA